ncbi:hypothetical protein [Microbacterium sp. NPDC091662]|uniref:hypothetical protein n=1 Tax=Microbacterium sp. NPDC091662 TaxID=3364211 RepID=UPI00380AFEBB
MTLHDDPPADPDTETDDANDTETDDATGDPGTRGHIARRSELAFHSEGLRPLGPLRGQDADE